MDDRHDATHNYSAFTEDVAMASLEFSFKRSEEALAKASWGLWLTVARGRRALKARRSEEGKQFCLVQGLQIAWKVQECKED